MISTSDEPHFGEVYEHSAPSGNTMRLMYIGPDRDGAPDGPWSHYLALTGTWRKGALDSWESPGPYFRRTADDE